MGLEPKLGTAIFLICLTATAVSASPILRTFSVQYGSFNESHYDELEREGSASIHLGALQVTPDSAGNLSATNVSLYNSSGRVLLDRPFKLWDGEIHSDSPRVASFNSSFLINVHRMNSSGPGGEGLAFLIAPDKSIPPASDSQYLGLTNATTDGDPNNHIVAVELDTFKQDFDVDANHIGLDIHTVKSNISYPLSPLDIEISPNGSDRYYNIWVQYDGVAKTISAYIAEQDGNPASPTPPRPSSPVLTSPLDLRATVAQNSYFGFAASTGDTAQLNCVLRWNLTVEYYAEEGQEWWKVVVGVGVPAAAGLLMGAAALGYYIRRRNLRRSDTSILGALKSLPGTPREFDFKELSRATNSFHERNKLGQGGYGVVYKGWLQSERVEVAVKLFSRDRIKSQDDFLAELTIINRLRHRHLVRLLGWCHKNGKLMLVYEYMPNGSLDKHLYGDGDPLSWSLRYKIISGLASALHYLHNDYDQRVVHRDLKPSNIMLDADFNARLGDFGLARALDREKNSYTEAAGVLGTAGYIAPECFHTGKATQQSDIYALGAVLLEVVSGHRPGAPIAPFSLPVDWVWWLYREGRLMEAVDPRLGEDYVAQEVERVLLLGLACSHPMADQRLETKEIVQILSGAVGAPHVPLFKPAFVWPAMTLLEGDMSLATTMNTSTSIATSRFESSAPSPHCLSREPYVSYTGNYSSV